MTGEEIIDLLTLCAGFDQRTVGKADVTAWGLAIESAPVAVTIEDACRAVVAHYADQPETRIMPAHVIDRVRRLRTTRIEAVVEPAPDVDPDNIPAWLTRRRANLKALADGREAPHQLATGTVALPVGPDGLPDVTGICPTRTIPGPGAPPPDPNRDVRRQVLAVVCPACRAGEGRMCTLEMGEKSTTRKSPHPSRELVAGVRPPTDDEDHKILARYRDGAA